MPYQLAYLDTEDISWLIIDLTIDVLFFIDVIINLMSSYTTDEGELEYSHKKVVKQYFKTWFLLDIIACIPTALIE